MKKISILMTLFIFSSAAIIAQVNSTSQNGPNSTNTGYQLEFKGVEADNCPAKIPYDQFAAPSEWGATYTVGNDTLAITTNGTQQDYNAFYIRFADKDCNNIALNLKDNQHLRIKIKSSVAVPQCILWIRDSYDNTANEFPIWKALVVGDNVLEVSDINFSIYGSANKVDSTSIAMLGIGFRKGAGDGNVSGTFKISSIELGDNVTVTGMESTLAESTLKYYPNPAQDKLSVSFKSNGNTELALSDMSGRKLKIFPLEGGQNDIVINTNDLLAGMYLMSIQTNDGIVSKLITVSK